MPLIFTFVVIELPVILLIYHLVSRELLSSGLPALLVVLDVGTLISMFLCAYKDPGILPQIVNNYEWSEELLYLPAVNHNMQVEHSYLSVGVWGLSTLQKYCVECHVYRPTRTIHCRYCNHCVELYDHHCPWLGVCIGKHNYKRFVAFLVVLDLMVLVSLGCCLAVIILGVLSNRPFLEYLLEVIVGAVSLGFGLALVKLLGYHFGLISRGVTTNEDLKDTYKIINGMVPFSRCNAAHPPFVDLDSKLMKTDEVELSLGEDVKNVLRVSGKGKRYSTLVSGRQSVLNSLVDNEL